MIEIDFNKRLKFKKLEVKELITASLQKCFETLKINQEDYYVSIFLTDDENIRNLNLKFRKIDKATNVLSFVQDEKFCLNNSKCVILLGDIVISLEKIYEEAKNQQKKFSHHLMHICVHGLLHLFGYSHEKEIDAEVMQEKEITILSNLSVPSPY